MRTIERTPAEDLDWALYQQRHFESIQGLLSKDKQAWGLKKIAFWKERAAHHSQRLEAMQKGAAA